MANAPEGEGMMRLTRRAYAALRAHCRSSREEVCGFCLGSAQGVSAVRRATNAAPSQLRPSLCVVAPEDLLWFAREQMKGRVLAFYHSHPNIPAEPSAIDLRGLPFRNIAYLIYSCSEDSLRAWRWIREQMREEKVT